MVVMVVMVVIVNAQEVVMDPLVHQVPLAPEDHQALRAAKATKETKETKETRATKDVMAPLALLGHLTLPTHSSMQTGQLTRYWVQRTMLFLIHQVQSSMAIVLPAPALKYTYGSQDGITCITISITRNHVSFLFL
jgi:hypothetical protein